MKNKLAILFILMFLCSMFMPADARTVLRYGAQNNASGSRITYYPYKKPEPQVRYVYVNPYEKSKYDENGYHLAENEPKKRGGGSHVIYSAFPMHKPNFGGGIIGQSGGVSTVRTVRSGASYRIGGGALRHPSISYSAK